MRSFACRFPVTTSLTPGQDATCVFCVLLSMWHLIVMMHTVCTCAQHPPRKKVRGESLLLLSRRKRTTKTSNELKRVSACSYHCGTRYFNSFTRPAHPPVRSEKRCWRKATYFLKDLLRDGRHGHIGHLCSCALGKVLLGKVHDGITYLHQMEQLRIVLQQTILQVTPAVVQHLSLTLFQLQAPLLSQGWSASQHQGPNNSVVHQSPAFRSFETQLLPCE